jgi:hypothetical protein
MQPLKVGNVIQVTDRALEVLLTTRDMLLEHEGQTYRVGQLGSYVTVPLDDKTLVGFVIGVGRQDTTAVDLEPERVMHVQLVGTIQNRRFYRGVNEYPTLGDDVWVAVQKDFEVMFGSFDALLAGSDHPRSFSLGRFVLNPDFEVKVLGKEFFAKHAAILGNSGAGKSCTVAKILQESIRLPESQIILFDLHGEYAAAFVDPDRRTEGNVNYVSDRDLVLPYWFLQYEEMETLLIDRTNVETVGSQVSFLKTALAELKQPAARALDIQAEFTIDTPIYYDLAQLKMYAENLNEARYVLNTDQLAFSRLAQRGLKPELQWELMRTQRCAFNKGAPEGETPHALYHGKLTGVINALDTRLDDRRYDFMLRPIEHAAGSRYFCDVIRATGSPRDLSEAMITWIKLVLGRTEPRSNLTIIDLSGIPFDVVDITVAVMTRMIFDFNFWCPPDERHPAVLIYEEAHNYIPRRTGRRRSDRRLFARRAVEKVAKEGRKYGVSAVVVSQRPSELSETVLSQCNNMVVMRMSNPDDQAYVTKVVGDAFSSVIGLLPVLRPGEGFVIGDSVLMPLRTQVDLPARQPRSADVDVFRHWVQGTPSVDAEEVLQRWWRQDRQALNRTAWPIAADESTTQAVPAGG